MVAAVTASREHVYRVTEVVRVIDGDTFWLRCDVGFRFQALVEVRAAGVDCPESRKGSLFERRKAVEARELTGRWLTGSPAGSLWVATEPDPDDFGRWLGDVWAETPAGGVRRLAEALTAAGLATNWPTRWRTVYDPTPTP